VPRQGLAELQVPLAGPALGGAKMEINGPLWSPGHSGLDGVWFLLPSATLTKTSKFLPLPIVGLYTIGSMCLKQIRKELVDAHSLRKSEDGHRAIRVVLGGSDEGLRTRVLEEAG
jgi:hypothetical protein